MAQYDYDLLKEIKATRKSLDSIAKSLHNIDKFVLKCSTLIDIFFENLAKKD